MARGVSSVLAIAGLALVLLEGAVASRSSVALPSPSFRPARAWVVVRPTKAEQPGVYRSMMLAATRRDVGVLRPFALFTSFKRLSSRGIIVWAVTVGRDRPGFRRIRWPPELSTFRVDHGWEGQPAANIQQRLKFGSVRGWDLDVRVFFATQHPDQTLLEEAQAELRRLRLPSAG
jgi:hypothetical protein